MWKSDQEQQDKRNINNKVGKIWPDHEKFKSDQRNGCRSVNIEPEPMQFPYQQYPYEGRKENYKSAKGKKEKIKPGEVI